MYILQKKIHYLSDSGSFHRYIHMRFYVKLVVFFILIAVSAIEASAEKTLTIVADEYELKRYKLLLAQKGPYPLNIHDFSSRHSNRTVANLILLQQALHQGGSNYTIEFVPAPNPSRAISIVKSGKAALLGNDIWDCEFDERVYKSSEIIGSGEFEKIIVGRQDNTQLMQAKSLKDLQPLSVVTGHDWHVDIQTLAGMKVNYINKVPLYSLQFKMLTAGRVDFSMLEASYLHEEKKTELQKMNLGVVPGIKIGLVGSRHYMVSKKHPEGEQALEILERGLTILRAKGLIKKAMTDVGFYNAKISDWQKLYPPI